MLLMIKTMKSGLKLQVHIWSNLSKGGWEGEFWGKASRAKADTKAHTTVDDDDNGDSHELTATFA